jgi:2-oxoglutarate dehydrogenase E2 component (dihydrolipoamide succinyltransferase)
MAIEIKVPSVGESVTEALLAQWYKQDGDRVQKDELLFLIETDKVTLEVVAEADGILRITAAEGETVAVGAVVGTIDPDVESPAKKAPTPPEKIPEAPPPPPEPEPEKAPPLRPPVTSEQPEAPPVSVAPGADIPLSPAVRRLVAEKNLNANKIIGTGPGGRITKGDVLIYLESTPMSDASKPAIPQPVDMPQAPLSAEEPTERKAMSPIRQRIAARLLESKQNTAMLTTFNEIDMSNVQAFRAEFKEAFRKRYDVSLGIMSFFVKACVAALKEIPELNAFIDGQDIVYHHYHNIAMAIGAERGLVVPVIRHAGRLSFADIELAIVNYVKKIKENRLELSDLEGGTFTITNGGVFGSLLSTPILNMPQSGILGMHKIEDRPVVLNGQVVIRPMMYVALSYDHRIVDGREAVTFLRRIKECIESPERIMVEI